MGDSETTIEPPAPLFPLRGRSCCPALPLPTCAGYHAARPETNRMSDIPVHCIVEGMLNDSPHSIKSLLRRLAPIYAQDVTAWRVDLSQCTHIGASAAATVTAVYLNATQRGVDATVVPPLTSSVLDPFVTFPAVAQHLAGKPLPTSDPGFAVPVRVQTTANFNDPDPIVALISRHRPLNVDAEEYLRICINEVIQNVEDHARSPVGCVTCARFSNDVGEVRVAIVDSGIGIGTTLRSRYPGITSAADALARVLEGGYSAKSRPNNMGVGISNLANIVIRQLNGELLIASEDAVAEGTAGKFPGADSLGVRFPGTAVFFSVPIP